MPDLYVFDGNNKPDIVNRIEVSYHRITKIKPKEPISEHTEYAVWDYTESLIIDRNSESIEHIQNIGTGCSVTRRYKVDSTLGHHVLKWYHIFFPVGSLHPFSF